MILPPNTFRQLDAIYSAYRLYSGPDYPGNLLPEGNAFLQGMKNTTGIDFIKIINKTGADFMMRLIDNHQNKTLIE